MYQILFHASILPFFSSSFFDLLGQTAKEAQHPAHTFVPKINRLAKHHRTAAGNHSDVVLLAEFCGLIRNAPLSKIVNSYQ
jgi:hypothetical protein